MNQKRTKKNTNKEDLHCCVVEKEWNEVGDGFVFLFIYEQRAACWVSETLTERNKLHK